MEDEKDVEIINETEGDTLTEIDPEENPDELLDVETDEEADDVDDADESDADVIEDVDDFELDEDGNIIIPEETEEPEAETEKEPEEPAAEAPEAKPETVEKSEYDKLREQYEDLLSLGRDALGKLGITEEDVRKGLAGLAAEASDKTPDEYLKERDDKKKLEAAKKIIQNQMYAERAKKDLAAIQAAFPETAKYNDMRDLPNIEKIARYIDLGLPADEAYAAVNSRTVREDAANSARQKLLNDSKNHLKSTVPVSSRDTTVKMSRSELDTYMEMFPDMSKSEIAKMYGKVTKITKN